MQKYYYSEIPKGLETISKDMLISIVKDAKIKDSNNKMVLFSTHLLPLKMPVLYFSPVTYYILKYFRSDYTLEKQVVWINKNFEQFVREINKYFRGKTFRIIASRKDIKRSLLMGSINKLEKILQNNFNVQIDKGHPDYEITIVEKENHGFIGIRISKPKEFKDQFSRYSLPKEIASIMLYLTDPNLNDIFLDPLCGGGILPLLRSIQYPYKHIFANDINVSHLNSKIEILDLNLTNITIFEKNFLTLNKVLPFKVNKIAVDPPWGLLNKIKNISHFYQDIFNLFYKITSNPSTIVLLTSRSKIINRIVNNSGKKFSINSNYLCSVSGKPATIFKIFRN